MSTKRTGVVDPWRKVETTKQEPVTREGRIDIASYDPDADLVLASFHVFRGIGGCIRVEGPNIRTEADALRSLAGCLLDVSHTLQALDIGVRLGEHMFNMPRENVDGFYIRSTDAAVEMPKSTRLGMRKLVQALREISTDPKAETTIRNWGITPMLK